MFTIGQPIYYRFFSTALKLENVESKNQMTSHYNQDLINVSPAVDNFLRHQTRKIKTGRSKLVF